jgi:hypothetical protein
MYFLLGIGCFLFFSSRLFTRCALGTSSRIISLEIKVSKLGQYGQRPLLPAPFSWFRGDSTGLKTALHLTLTDLLVGEMGQKGLLTACSATSQISKISASFSELARCSFPSFHCWEALAMLWGDFRRTWIEGSLHF